MRKHKKSSTISIIGLAVGFACFILSIFWVQYEQSFDNFHKKADNIYRVRHLRKGIQADSLNPTLDIYTAYPFAELLKSNFPDIEDACRVFPDEMRLNSGKICQCLAVDTSFFRMFDIPLEPWFFNPGSDLTPVIITEKAAKDIFKDINVIGKTIKTSQDKEYQIRGVVKEWPGNTNYPFDILIAANFRFDERILSSMGMLSFHTYALINPKADINSLNEKLRTFSVKRDITSTGQDGESRTFSFNEDRSSAITPIKDLHHKKPDDRVKRNVTFSHISIFAIASILIIFCALFNYLSLFLNFTQVRDREFSLRKTNGSLDIQIIKLLISEVLLTLIISIGIGYCIILVCLPKFKELSMIELSHFAILKGSAVYTIGLITCVLLVCLAQVAYFRRKSLRENITGSSKIRNVFRKVSLLLQLVIGLGFMFCSFIFFKQIHYLRHSDIGFDRSNIAAVAGTKWSYVSTIQYIDKVKQVPFVTEIIKTSYPTFIRNMSSSSLNTGGILFQQMNCELGFIEFYNIQLKEGRLFNESDFFVRKYDSVVSAPSKQNIIINETAAKLIEEVQSGNSNDNNSIEQFFSRRYSVIGIVKDFYYESPTTPIKPIIITCGYDEINPLSGFAYKYEKGYRRESEKAIEAIIHADDPDKELEFIYLEDEYEKFLQSEKSLSTIIAFMTLTCILIAIFGVYSLTSFFCEQRRKEIAIRKVNGAEVHEIANIFFKEYLYLLIIAAIIAFPAGYHIMSTWLENYTKRTTMDAWIFVLIFLCIAAIVITTIISMVWKAANQNPAEVIKSE